MRALITGATGFVGRHLVNHLLECGDEVLGTYLGEAPKDFPCQIVPLDITDSFRCQILISEYKPDTIFHLAAIAFVPEAEKDFRRTMDINVTGTHNIYRACDVLQQRLSVVLVSSGEVYGKISPDLVPITETVPQNPNNNYSLSKAMAELVALRYSASGLMRPVVMRAFNHIGPGQHRSFVVSSFAEQLAQIKLGKLPPIVRVGNLEAKKDFTDVRDVVRAYRLAAEKGSGVYNIGSNKAVSVRELLDTLIDISGVKVSVEVDPLRYRPIDVKEVRCSYDKAKTELGWTPKISTRQSLEDAFNLWISEHSVPLKAAI
jgi:GDP-4-dehydro-6-deoxy-D-mannose reductase